MHTRASIPSAVALPLAPLESLHRAVAGLVMLLIVARTGMALRGGDPGGTGFHREVGVRIPPASVPPAPRSWVSLRGS